MVAPPIIFHQQLTGRTRHRRSLLGKMVLQVEFVEQRIRLLSHNTEETSTVGKGWRDATFDDWHALLGGGTGDSAR